MYHRTGIRFLAMLLGLVALQGVAAATECEPIYQDVGQMYRWYGGVGNASYSAGLFLSCPVNVFNNPPPNGSVNMTIGASGSSQQAYCYPSAYTASKGGWWGSAKWLCGTAGGCTSATVAGAYRTGTLSWTNPFGTGALAGLRNYQFECLLPPGGGDALITNWNSTATIPVAVVGEPGTNCQGSYATSGSVYRIWGGAGNASSTNYMWLNCGGLPAAGYDIYATIGSSGANQYVACSIGSYTDHNTSWYGNTVYLCASSPNGGCTSPTVAGAYTTGKMSPTPSSLGGNAVKVMQAECYIPADAGDALITRFERYATL